MVQPFVGTSGSKYESVIDGFSMLESNEWLSFIESSLFKEEIAGGEFYN